MKLIRRGENNKVFDKAPERLITLEDFVMRDEQQNVERWILWKCDEALKLKKISRGWDGVTVEGEAVLAFVNFGRWMARCKVCANPYLVSHQKPILYCFECGNGGSSAAYPVQFPEEREQIEAELLKREVNLKQFARNSAEAALHSHAKVRGLGRDWRPGVSVRELELQRVEKTKDERGGR